MKYIGPYFRMNNLSKDNIKSQLFFLSKESLKTILLNSKCGIELDKKVNLTNDINIQNKIYPLTCIYRKSSPSLINTKSSTIFDQSTIKKEITPLSNALMTLCTLELSTYYKFYEDNDRKNSSHKNLYISLCKNQLDFYYNNLRNDEGLFISKKNSIDANVSSYSLINSKDKFKFSDQAFMMISYYLYSMTNSNDKECNEYKNFALEIFSMFIEYKEELYSMSFDESVKVLFCFNLMYKYSSTEQCKNIILDLCDLCIDKFNSKNYYSSSLDYTGLLAICLRDCYKITEIDSFMEISNSIMQEFKKMYDEKNHIFIKPPKDNSKKDKKEIKYSCTEIALYFLTILILDDDNETNFFSKNAISNMYKKMIIDSSLICSFPEAPTLDEIERYRKLSLLSEDMLEEISFRMPRCNSPKLTSLAPVFIKSITYNRKKDTFSVKHKIFDSDKNLLIFFLVIHYLKDNVISQMNFT